MTTMVMAFICILIFVTNAVFKSAGEATDCSFAQGGSVSMCPHGFTMDIMTGNCKDIDECACDVTNLCSYKPGCANTQGNFTCSCPVDQELMSDKRTCKVTNPDFEFKPMEILLDLTASLEANCSFSMNSAGDMVALVSLLISQSSDSGQTFSEIASITEFKPKNVNLVTKDPNIQAEGFLDEVGESNIYLKWLHPTSRQGGLYQCSAQGIDVIGHNVVMINFAQIGVAQPVQGDFVQKLIEMENYTKTLEENLAHLNVYCQQLEDTIRSETANYTITLQQKDTELNNCTHSLEQTQIQLGIYQPKVATAQMDRQNALSQLFETITFTYNNHTYYASKDGYYDVVHSSVICNLCGGYLTEIDDVEEYHALQAFVSNFSGVFQFLIGGNDKETEGVWVLPSTGTPLPFEDWASGHPLHSSHLNNTLDCLYLDRSSLWKMTDDNCHLNTPDVRIRYTCEMPEE